MKSVIEDCVLTWRGWGAGLHHNGTGWYGGVGIRGHTFCQFLQLHSDGNQIWRTQFSIHMFKLLHLMKKEI